MIYFLFLPLLFVTISMTFDTGNQEVLLPTVKKVANHSLKEKILSNHLSFISSLTNADPVEVNKVLVIIEQLTATGEVNRENARVNLDNKQEMFNTACDVLDAATQDVLDVAAQLSTAKKVLQERLDKKLAVSDAAQEVDRLLVLEAEKKAIEDVRAALKVAANDDLDEAKVYWDNESIRLDAERNLLLKVKQLLAGFNHVGKWFLLFRQTVPFVTDPASWMHLGSPSEPNYSILDELEIFRSTDKKFHFKLVWPELRQGVVFNEWKQTSNPTTSTRYIGGYEAVHIDFSHADWRGLSKSERDETLLDGTPYESNWCYAVGTSKFHRDAIPACCVTGSGKCDLGVQNIAELYVMKDN